MKMRQLLFIAVLLAVIVISACEPAAGPQQPQPPANSECTADSDCGVGGCSGQVCTEADKAAGLVTTCEYREEYGCYQKASCGCVSGKCGWKPTSELQACLDSAKDGMIPVDTPITMEGEIVCLPHRDKTGVQTLECAYGFFGIDNRYYGLKNLNQMDLVEGKITTGQQIQISGTLLSEPSNVEEKMYDIAGTIEVESYAQVGTSTVQPEDPNKTGLSPYPDLSITSLPKESVSVKFVVEHRSALDGKTVQVRGVVVGTLLGEKACPSSGMSGMCAMPRIYLSDTSAENRDKAYDLTVLVTEDGQEGDYSVGKIIEVQGIVAGSKSGVVIRKV